MGDFRQCVPLSDKERVVFCRPPSCVRCDVFMHKAIDRGCTEQDAASKGWSSGVGWSTIHYRELIHFEAFFHPDHTVLSLVYRDCCVNLTVAMEVVKKPACKCSTSGVVWMVMSYHLLN